MSESVFYICSKSNALADALRRQDLTRFAQTNA